MTFRICRLLDIRIDAHENHLQVDFKSGEMIHSILATIFGGELPGLWLIDLFNGLLAAEHI